MVISVIVFQSGPLSTSIWISSSSVFAGLIRQYDCANTRRHGERIRRKAADKVRHRMLSGIGFLLVPKLLLPGLRQLVDEPVLALLNCSPATESANEATSHTANQAATRWE
jgi:endonuclease V-like protein UPF0215 family